MTRETGKLARLAALVICLGVSAGAHAQSAVSIYGAADTGVEYIDKVGQAGTRLIRVPSTVGAGPSRLGFRGSEDLGGGLKADFNLEMGIFLDTGTLGQGGRAFGRYSYVGLSGPWGRVMLGRFVTSFLWATVDVDVLGPNVYGLGSLDSYLNAARVDNGVGYMGTFGAFTVGANVSSGRDSVGGCPGEIAGNQRACTEWSAMVKYETPDWGAAYGIDSMRGGPGAAAGLVNSTLQDQRQTVNAFIKYAWGRVGAGLIRRENDGSATTPKSNLYFLSLQYQFSGPLVLDAELSRIAFSNSSNASNMAALRGSYYLSKRTSVYLTGGRIQNGGTLNTSVSLGAAGSNAAVGGTQNAVMAGIRHSF